MKMTVSFLILLFFLTSCKNVKDKLDSQKERISIGRLNALVVFIEFYKMQHGAYPESLQQVNYTKDFWVIGDVVPPSSKNKRCFFNYERLPNGYTLYSSGRDGIANSKDDLFPEFSMIDRSKTGYIKK